MFLKYVSSVKYLDVYFVATKCFKLSVDHLKVRLYHVSNCIFSRVKASNTEFVVVNLLKAHSLLLLLYASEAVLSSVSNIRSLDNCINCAIFKYLVISDCIQAIYHFVNLHNLKHW